MSGYDIDGIANTPLAPLVRLDVRGASSNDGGDGDLFEVKMYVNDNGVWKSSILNKKGYVNEDGLDQIMKNIGSATVADVLKYGQ